MDDYVRRWRLDELHVLDEHAIEGEAPSPGPASFTICFWFLSWDAAGRQVIANQGCMAFDSTGWMIFLDRDALHFRTQHDDGQAAEVTVPIISTNTWLHVAGVVDRQQGQLTLSVQSPAGAESSQCQSTPLPAARINSGATLILGGYTDPAGGHFDHTFGRNRTGLLDDVRIYARALSQAEFDSFVVRSGASPTAHIEVDAANGDAPIRVRFNGQKSGEEIEAYLWDFGDGTRGFGATPAHHYDYAGQYPVRLTVVDDSHAQATVQHTLNLGGKANPLRTTPVFVNGLDGYGCYRIPSIVRAANGDLVAFAEGRLENCSDSTRTIHIVCKRSTDNGLTWGPLQVIATNDRIGELSVAQNCCPVVDTVRGTGRIVVLFNRAEYSEWDLAGGRGVSRIYRIVSDNNGQSWHDERDITPYVHRPYNPDYAGVYAGAADARNRETDWRIQRPTLGHAIQLTGPIARGRLFFAGVFTAGDRTVFDSQNYVFWSDDLGETWTIGGIVPQIGLNEATAVELEDGDILINTRAYHEQCPAGRRAVTRVALARDGGVTFGPTVADPALVDPAVQASLLRYSWADDDSAGNQSRILFANPDHPHARRNMTVRLSVDEGRTWAFSRAVDPGPAAYSDLVVQSDSLVGLLYERGNQGGIVYTAFPLHWLTGGYDVGTNNSSACSGS